MAITVANVQEFTDAQLLILYRNAIAAVATGQTYTIGGRSLSRANLPEIRETIGWLEGRIESEAADVGGNIALGRFGDVT